MRLRRARNIYNKLYNLQVVKHMEYKEAIKIIGITGKKASKALGLCREDDNKKIKKRMPHKIRNISFSINEYGKCLTMCPYRQNSSLKSICMVGSFKCKLCKYNYCTYKVEQKVTCGRISQKIKKKDIKGLIYDN